MQLTELPFDLIFAVLAGLDGRSVASFAMVSHACCSVATHEGLWKILLSKRWKVEDEPDNTTSKNAREKGIPKYEVDGISWRALYKKRELVAAPILSLIYFRDSQHQAQSIPTPTATADDTTTQPSLAPAQPSIYQPVGLGLLTIIHKVIVQNCQFTERRLASDALSHLVEADRQMPHLLITVVQQEVLADLMTDEAIEDGLRDESVFASANWVLLKRKLCGAPSLSSDLFYSYAKLVGLPFLKAAVSPIISSIMATPLSLTLQIAALPATETKQKNVNACCDFVRALLNGMDTSLSSFPMQLRLFFRQLRNELSRLLPDEDVATACFADVALNLLFNKFILPSLVRPEAFGLALSDDLDIRHAQTRKLVLMTRLLSCVAENRPFSEAEGDYIVFNSFVSSESIQSKLHGFILRLAEVDANAVGDSFYDPLRWNDIEASLRFLYRIIDNNIIEIKKAIVSQSAGASLLPSTEKKPGELVPLSPVPHPLGSSRNRQRPTGISKSPSRLELHRSYGTSRYLLHKSRGIVPPRRAYSAPVPRGVNSFSPTELFDLLQAQLRKIEDLLKVHSASMIFSTIDSDPLDVFVDMPPPQHINHVGPLRDGANRHCSLTGMFVRGISGMVKSIWSTLSPNVNNNGAQ